MLTGELSTPVRMSGELYRGVSSNDYNNLENKPTYNGHIIEGDLTSDILGIWQPKNFSTDEQNTGLKWIDGKEIYFKTLIFSLGSSVVTILDNITPYSELINIIGNIFYGGYMDAMPYTDPNDFCIIRLNSGVLECAISNYFKNNGNVKATVFYTKI